MANDTKANVADLAEEVPPRKEKKRELLMFLFLTVVLFPALAICLVGGYGFIVWIFQIIAGPPGPPGA